MAYEIDISYTTYDKNHCPEEHYESFTEHNADDAFKRFQELVATVPMTLIVMSQLSRA